MMEEFEFSKLQESFIDKAKKEVDFVKNVEDVKKIEWYDGDGKKIIGLDDDKQEFFMNGEEARSIIGYSDSGTADFLYYKHKDGTEVFLQDVSDMGEYAGRTLFVKGQDYFCYSTNYGKRCEDGSYILISIGKIGQKKPDAEVVFRGTANIKEGVGPNNPDLYDLYNRYVPQDINVKDVLAKLDMIKKALNIKDALAELDWIMGGCEKSQQRVSELDNKIIEAKILKSALDKWNSGR